MMHVGDVLKCGMTMWRSFFTQRFERQEDGSCMITAHDARSDQTSQLRIVVRKQSNEHLRHNIDRSISLALNSQLETIGRKKRTGSLVKELLTRSMFGTLLATNSITPLGKWVNSLLIPVNCS
jgi:hypothetical protein